MSPASDVEVSTKLVVVIVMESPYEYSAFNMSMPNDLSNFPIPVVNKISVETSNMMVDQCIVHLKFIQWNKLQDYCPRHKTIDLLKNNILGLIQYANTFKLFHSGRKDLFL